MKNNAVLDALMSKPNIKNLGLTRDAISSILQLYSDVAINYLLENGTLDIGNGLSIEVVKLLDRVHVLRGTPYKSSRKYKLKLKMDDSIYKTIGDYYDKLQEDIS